MAVDRHPGWAKTAHLLTAGFGGAMNKWPIVYIRGYGGATAGINAQVDDPFYGFNSGSTHIRVAGDGVPAFYQFEGPLVRLIGDEQYKVYVEGSQQLVLDDPSIDIEPASLWIHRFYDQAATTFRAAPHENLAQRLLTWGHQHVTADGFNIEEAAEGLYALIAKILQRTGAPKVYIVAHSMGGLIARCMIQKICRQDGHAPASQIVARLFTYGTPHGGIRSAGGVAQWVEATFGPAGSNIFAPELMQGYLDPSKKFGDVCDRGWDPQVIDNALFPLEEIFCLVGTDPADYGWASRTAMGPQTDGLVHIDNAYVRGAHRAYVHRSHSGAYGEVNSEEGYQNLRRFLFGRWAVAAALVDAGLPQDPAISWQMDMRLAIRGMSVVMSEQTTEHWCPIMLSVPSAPAGGPSPQDGVTLVRTFLLDPADRDPEIAADDRRMRYTITLRLFGVHEVNGVFDFSSSTEQLPLWQDSLIVDVEPSAGGSGSLKAYAAWNSTIPGASQNPQPISLRLPPEQSPQLDFEVTGDGLVAIIGLPEPAVRGNVMGGKAGIRLTVSPRPPQQGA
jgi:pimeloyl-ACP methyl ester carboxylesterase